MKIKDIAKKISSGGTPTTQEASYYNGGNIPWLRTQEVNFNFINDTEIKITEEGLRKSSAKWVERDSIIVAMYGNSAGRVAYSNIPLTTNQACCNITVDSTKADSRYLYYYLTTQYNNLKRLANGGAQQNLNAEMIKIFKFPNIHLSEQKRISSILSSFDNKIEQLKKENNILEDIAQNIFKEWFVKYNFPNKDGKPYKDNGGKMIDSELGEIPEGWGVGKLGDIAIITSGKGLPKEDLDQRGAYEVLGANGVIGKTNKKLFDKELIYTGRVGTLGNVFLSKGPAWYSDNTLLIFPKKSFYYYVFRKLERQRLEKLDRGSTQPLIIQTDLKSIPLPIPTLSLLGEFEKKHNLINKRINTNKENIQNLQKVKMILIDKLIS